MCHKKPTPQPASGENNFLLGAINDYPMPGADLNGCINDQGIMNRITDGLGLTYFNYQNGEWTRKKLFYEFELASRSQKTGTFTFHQSSHGTYDYVNGRLVQAMVMADGSLVYDFELVELVKKFSLSVVVDLLLDLCFSGGMSRLLQIDPLEKPRFYQMCDKPKTERAELPPEINAVLFAACREDQTAADAYIAMEQKYYGAFSYRFSKAFVPGLSKQAVFNRITMKGYEQVPMLLGAADKYIPMFGQAARKKFFWL